MGEIAVREAGPQDAGRIVELRNDYYGRRNAPIQERYDGLRWIVAERHGRVEACQSWKDASDADAGTQRWVMDTYCEPTRGGRLALAALSRYTHAEADREGLVLLGLTEQDNLSNQGALERRGWKPVGILYARQPGSL